MILPAKTNLSGSLSRNGTEEHPIRGQKETRKPFTDERVDGWTFFFIAFPHSNP